MIESKQTWPNSRRAARVLSLHSHENQPQMDFSAIPVDGTVVDLGMGNGSFLIDVRKERKDLTLIGVTASPSEIRHHTCNYANINIVCGKLPHDRSVVDLLSKYQNTVDVIFDTYGPSTYSYNPLHSLIFSAMLLKEGGIFSAITGTEGTVNTTVFGNAETQKKLIAFFKDELDITIQFLPQTIESEVVPGKIMTDFLVSFVKGNKSLNASDYMHLCKQADKAIGLVKKIPNNTDNLFKFGQFKIEMKEYEKPKYYNQPVELSC